jgi:hypothetical protein
MPNSESGSEEEAAIKAGTRRRHDQRATFRNELADAISFRTFGLVVGVLVLQLAFIASYVGAFHQPKAHHIGVVIAGPETATQQMAAQLNAVAGRPLRVTTTTQSDQAHELVRHGKQSAALIVDAQGTRDQLIVASGGGSSIVTTVETAIQKLETTHQRTIEVVDIVPLQTGDARGLTGFYLVTGWIVGGYLVAALLGVARGARPANLNRCAIRLLAMIPYAVVSGLGGALIVDNVLGALTGHFLALWGIGVMLVFCAGTITLALQVVAGVLGIGLTVLFFVVLGNPSAGGAYQAQLLPPFWRFLHGALPNGAGTEAVRQTVYFPGTSISSALVTVSIWTAAGVAVALIGAQFHEMWRRRRGELA